MLASYCSDAVGDHETIIKKEGSLVFRTPQDALEYITKYDMRCVVLVNAQGRWERDTAPYDGDVSFRNLNKTMRFAVWVAEEEEEELNPLYS
jgi:hypothetical protein